MTTRWAVFSLGWLTAQAWQGLCRPEANFAHRGKAHTAWLIYGSHIGLRGAPTRTSMSTGGEPSELYPRGIRQMAGQRQPWRHSGGRRRAGSDSLSRLMAGVCCLRRSASVGILGRRFSGDPGHGRAGPFTCTGTPGRRARSRRDLQLGDGHRRVRGQ